MIANTDDNTGASDTAPLPDPTTPRPAPPDGANGAPDPSRGDAAPVTTDRPVEIGGQKGPEPTRYGDWEKKGRCTDF